MKKKDFIFIFAGIVAIKFIIYCKKQRKNNDPKIYYKKKLFNNYNGFIIPPFGIFIKESEKNNIALLEHEKIHWKQFQREGLLPFTLNYLKEATTKGYDKNKYEIEARFIENDFCKENYTECVRNGLSKTVYNKNFRK